MHLDDTANDLSVESQLLKLEENKSSEEEFISILAEKVEVYLERNPDLLMSYLYRLDVDERRIQKALSNQSDEPGNLVLARLIWDRQKKRLETKKQYMSKGKVDNWYEF